MGGFHFEGKVSNVSMADAVEPGSSTALARDAEAAKAPFKYVLLQVTFTPCTRSYPSLHAAHCSRGDLVFACS
jgi:hypothetical protein